MVTAGQQDRWSNGGAHGLAAGVSTTGGSSWRVVPLPFSACASNAPADLQYQRASDPWISFGPGAPANPSGATTYSVSISFNQTASQNGNTVGAAVSYDGGLTWTHAQSMHADAQSGVPIPVPDSNFQFFHDKESVTADPITPGEAYAVWDVLIGPNANMDADIHSSAFTDDTLFTRTTDFGATWSPVRIINQSANPTSQNNQTIGNVITVDPRTGTLYDFFNQIFHTGGNGGGAHGDNAAFQRSTDGGLTWTSPQLISAMDDVGVADPNNVDPRTNRAPAPFRVGNGLPVGAVDPETGDLYVVWEDARFSGSDETVITRSTDGGATWSTPKRVNTPTGQPAFTPVVAGPGSGGAGGARAGAAPHHPPSPPTDGGATWSTPKRVNTPTGQPAFTPVVAVTDSGVAGVPGTVAATYYQLSPTSAGSAPTSALIKRFSGAAVGSSDTDSIDTGVQATSVFGPFNMLDAPFALGYFVGDYEGLLTSGSGSAASFLPVF